MKITKDLFFVSALGLFVLLVLVAMTTYAPNKNTQTAGWFDYFTVPTQKELFDSCILEEFGSSQTGVGGMSSNQICYKYRGCLFHAGYIGSDEYWNSIDRCNQQNQQNR